ncbi:MAG: iron ABC transporter permease, partial [Oscillospiraceae bacterium]|nr:iron ABC transporter permease [Oscillospiraceae bacterium]
MAVACAAAFILAVGLGSVFVAPADIFKTLAFKLFGVSFERMPAINVAAIVWNLRLPRAILAFLTGAALAASGAVMQSVLQNPLASSFT